jgi:hypothetical protein
MSNPQANLSGREVMRQQKHTVTGLATRRLFTSIERRHYLRFLKRAVLRRYINAREIHMRIASGKDKLTRALAMRAPY